MLVFYNYVLRTGSVTLLLLVFIITHLYAQSKKSKGLQFFAPDHKYFRYTGRIDYTDPKLPRFWAAGVYIQARFKGSYCEVLLNDEEQGGKDHNYISIAIDDRKPLRLQTYAKTNVFKISEGLSEGEHTITICKNTESGIGYLEFAGFSCKQLLPLPAAPQRKIEFIGNSITCGTGMDIAGIPCDSGQWYDQHNAYESYGPLTARALNARWHLTCVAGIGLIHSCCNMGIVMDDCVDKVNMRKAEISWEFQKYVPDVLTICLGQNDGIRDSSTFCGAYTLFIRRMRKTYPQTQIVCLTSPMANDTLRAVLKKYITAVVDNEVKHGDSKVSKYYFSRGFNSGCGGHPDNEEHKLISAELSAYLKELMKW